MIARNTLLTAVAWLTVQIFAREVDVSPCYNNGYAVAVGLRRCPSQAWIHFHETAPCLSVGIDHKIDSGKWKRQCAGVQWGLVGGPHTFTRTWEFR